MKRMVYAALLTLLVSSVVGAAEPPAGSFWDSLKVRVEKVTPRKKANANTAVGGVRSAKQQDASLYWKGKDPLLEADEDEIALFKKALGKAVGGQRDESIKLFEAFLGKYTQSQLKADCLKALEQLKQEK